MKHNTPTPRTRSYRRHQTISHMLRRLREDRNQHYDYLTCSCWTDPKAIARFKEQPKHCNKLCCANPRRREKGKNRLTIQQRRFLEELPW